MARPKKDSEDKAVPQGVSLTMDLGDLLRALGGSNWLQQQLQAARDSGKDRLIGMGDRQAVTYIFPDARMRQDGDYLVLGAPNSRVIGRGKTQAQAWKSAAANARAVAASRAR